MKIKVYLINILDGKFRFYLKEEYRDEIFSILKNKYKDWRIVANKLDINVRNLFGIRRGYEYYKGNKTKRFLSKKHIINLSKIRSINLKDIERNIISIKLGFGGLNSNIKIPTTVDLKKESIKSVKRALAEYVFMKDYEKKINLSRLKSYSIKDKLLFKKIKIKNSKIDELRLRGLKPKLKENTKDFKISYRNPGTNQHVSRNVPKEIIFDEIFAKEFGKWLGDRCGGPNKIGVANKNLEFVEDFKNFLINKLNQSEKDLEILLTCKKDFNPNVNLKSKVNRIIYTKHQLGDFAFRVEIPNKIMKNLIFDNLEDNIFEILFNSKKSVRYSFYAGFFEAEGSIPKKSKDLIISFGFDLNKERSLQEYLDLFKKVIKFKYLLSIDGFNPRISRKVSKTEKSATLKYDIIMHCNSINRVKFIKDTIFYYINHKDKKARFIGLEEYYCN